MRQSQPSPDAASQQTDLPTICYGIAYFLLPHYAFKERDKLISIWTDSTTPIGPFFYVLGCHRVSATPDKQIALQFHAHQGALNDTYDYYVLEYPAPAPVDLHHFAPHAVLAPYFSAVLLHRDTGIISYYTLGQAPMGGGTTLRSVTLEINANHGRGPEPTLEAFLDRLRSR